MSTRGVNFLDQWMTDHLPDAFGDDPIIVSDLADLAMNDAESAGIKTEEIDEEVGSVFEMIFEALQHREGGLAD